MTNGDRIRNMNDMDLACLIIDRSSIFSCSECPSEYGDTNMACASCYKYIMEWLKSEVENE